MADNKKASAKPASSTFELEKPVHVVAIAQGYYGNRVLNAGQKFQYSGRVKKNRNGDPVLPSWVEIDKSVKDNDIVLKGEKPQSKSSQKSAKDLV